MPWKLTPILRAHWPIAVLLAAFAAIYSTSLNSYGMFTWDEAEYAAIGSSVLHGQGFSISGRPNPLRPPMLPLAGAAAMLIAAGEKGDDSILRETGCALALLTLLVTYSFAAAAFDRTVGLVSAALLGMSPFFWTFVPHFMCEIPFMAFFSAAVWFFYFGIYRAERFFLWSWICCSLAFLTRYTATLFLPVIAVSLPLALWLGGPKARRRIMSRAFLFSPLAGALVLLPWFIRQSVTFHDPLVGLKISSRQMQVFLPEISMPWHFYFSLLPAMLSLPIAVLCLAGMLWAFWKKEPFVLHGALAAMLILAWFSCYRYKEDRLASSAIPFLAVGAAIGLTKLASALRPLFRSAALWLILAGIFALNLTVVLPIFRHWVTLGYPSFLDAMTYLRSEASPEDVVLGANGPQIDWYSGLRTEEFPEEEQLTQALERSAWVVITNFEAGQKPYVLRLARQIALRSPQTVRRFSDRQFTTLVVRADSLLQVVRE
jgi:4-amino-4-deoxy-L-arabinose transferase-like glycosyltransferase